MTGFDSALYMILLVPVAKMTPAWFAGYFCLTGVPNCCTGFLPLAKSEVTGQGILGPYMAIVLSKPL